MMGRIVNRLLSILLSMVMIVNLCQLLGFTDAKIMTSTDVAASVGSQIDKEAVKAEEESKAREEIEEHLEDEGITLLPSLEEYYAENGGAPRLISYAEFQEKVGVQDNFDLTEANKYSNYQIRIDHKEDLLSLSVLCNSNLNPNEQNFLLSANYILGNNIEFNEGDFDGDGDPDSYFVPIGTEDHPFVGTFDGMGFEIRGLLFDTDNQDHNVISMFDVIGANGTVRNFGIYSVAQFLDVAGANVAVPIAFIANKNHGTIEKVYCDLSVVNPTSHAANITLAGLVMENDGTLSDCYFAGAMNMEGTNQVDPICYTNTGTIENAYYDSTILEHEVSGYSADANTTVEAATTLQLKTLGTNSTTDSFIFENDTEDTYHFHMLRNTKSTYTNINQLANNLSTLLYPKLYGFFSDFDRYKNSLNGYSECEIYTGADLIYFPTSPEYGYGYSTFIFHIIQDLDMSYVADDAYIPADNLFGGYHSRPQDAKSKVTAEVRDGEEVPFNGSYSLINFRITKLNANYDAGLIGNNSRGGFSNNVSIENINFIGGGVHLGQIDFDQSKAPIVHIGIAAGLYGGSCVNVHSSAVHILEDETVVPNICMGAITGESRNAQKFMNVTNVGKVNAGYHPNYDACNYSQTFIGGISGILQVGKGNSCDTIVNYGEVIGLGIYDTMSTDAERASGSLLNETANYYDRAKQIKIGGITGGTDTWIATPSGQYNYLANFGDVYDVPYTVEEVDVYDKDGTIRRSERPVGIVPDHDKYIINQGTEMAGICANRFHITEAIVLDYCGFDFSTGEYIEDKEYKGKIHNFGNVTAVESRSCTISGIWNGDFDYGCVLLNGENFGDLTSYTYSSSVYGLCNNLRNAYYSKNFGNIYVDHSSRSARQTLYVTNQSASVNGISHGHSNYCINYGDFHISYNAMDRGEILSSSNNNAQAATILGISSGNFYGVGSYSNIGCTNYGDLSFDVFDCWTGKYNYNELTEDKWYNRTGAKVNNSYISSIGNRFFTNAVVSGVGYGGAKNCVNNGDISIEGTPYDLLNDNSYDMVSTFQELCQKWGKDYASYYSSSYGFVSDANLVRHQNCLNGVLAFGISKSFTWQSDTGMYIENCINNGEINVEDGRGDCYISGVAQYSYFEDCVNRGDISFESKYNTGTINITGISQGIYRAENCINTGDIYLDACDFSTYIAGISISAGSPSGTWEMKNCVNLGLLTCKQSGVKHSNTGCNRYMAGIIGNIDIRNEVILSGCVNYGNLIYDADYEPSVKTGSTQYTAYWDDTIATLSNGTYGATDNCRIGGIIRYINFGTRSIEAPFTINTCFNHGNIDIDWEHLYPRYSVYAGGIVESTNKGQSSVGGNGYVFTNLINHGEINFDIQRDDYYYQTTNFENSRIGGIIGSFMDNYCSQLIDTPLNTILENLVNTGSINVDTHGNARNKPKVGGLTGYIYLANYITVNGSNETCHDYIYIDRIIDYQSEYRLIGSNNFTEKGWDFLNNDSAHDEPLTIYKNNTTNIAGINNMHKLMFGDNIYSAYPQEDTYTIGGGNYWIEEDGVRQQLLPTSYTVRKLTVDDIYPTETTPELLQFGYTNPVTGVICSFEYLNLAGLSEKYRNVYRSVNGITYLPKPEGDEGDEEFTATEEYQTWANQKGGYVLRAAEPAVAGDDYIPDNIILSDIKPTGCENWYRDIYKDGQTYNEALYLGWSQVNLLDLKEILSIILTNGEKNTISYRRATTANENIFYVYVPEGMTGTLEVDSYKLSSKAEAVFYDSDHNVIDDFDGYSFTFNGGDEEETFYATVTAQNTTEKDWKIIIKEYDGSQRFRITDAKITKSRYAYADNNELRYTQEELEDAKTTLNFWDTPLYCKGGTFQLSLDTINIISGYVLTDHMQTYYYPQNGYGITDYGLSLNLNKNSDLAELLNSGNGYSMDEKGDVYKDGRLVLELIQEVNLGKDSNNNDLFKTDGDIIKLEDDNLTLKAEKYSCYKGENSGDYYLENEANNILWSFIKSDGSPISRNDEDFSDVENGAYKREYNQSSYLGYMAGNKVKLNTGEGEEDGLLMGKTMLSLTVGSSLTGGCFETQFTMPDGSVRSLYFAKARDDEARSYGYNSGSNDGYADGQWISTESARQNIYDAHGAYQTWQDAHNAINDAYESGIDFPYISTINNGFGYFTTYYDNVKNTFWRFFAGFAGNPLQYRYDSSKPYYFNSTYYSNGALNRVASDRIIRNTDGSINYMDVIIQDTSEDLGLTRYHVAKQKYMALPTYSNSTYTENGNAVTPQEESLTLSGVSYRAIVIPKKIESTSVKSTYSGDCTFGNSNSFYAVQYCAEEGTEYGNYHKASYSTSGYTAEVDIDGELSKLTMKPYNNYASTTNYSTTINGDTLPGYYKITPVCAKTEYIYAYDYDDFIEQMEADDANIDIPCMNKSYEIEEIESVSGYNVYKVTMYVKLDSVVIHKCANDDCYLKNVFMQDEAGENILSVDSDIKWDNNNSYATNESQWNANHTSVAGKEDTIRYKDGFIRYNADPQYADAEQEQYIAEKVNAFEIYTYTKSFHTVNGQNQRVDDAYLKMQKSFVPLNGTLYYLDNGSWVEINFDNNGNVIASQQGYFHYEDFYENGTYKMFKVKAENGNTTYYKINTITNKRDKGVHIVLSDDNDTEEALAEIKQKYGTFVSDMHLVTGGQAMTSQVGIYDETGASGNNYCQLKFGNYDFTFNVPESAGYTYELCYTINNREVDLRRSDDDSNAYRLPLRIGGAFVAGQDITVTIKIKKSNAGILWGRMTERLAN